MDLERGQDDASLEDGICLAFNDIVCSIKIPFDARSWFRRTKAPQAREQLILNGACGAIRPGRLTFILGPSGAGKTSLMKILAGRKKSGVSGSVLGAGRDVVLVAQHATLIDTLTVKETLQFAASLKLPNATRNERNHTIESVSKQLGINEVFNTRTGLLSGGERKRLTIACELLTDPTIMLLDEPTSGLDSVSSMSVAQALRSVANSGRTVACVIHQPSSQLFTSADDVILLANGRTIYAGAISDLPETLKKSGFVCPHYYNMADYLLEIATGEHTGNLSLLEMEAKTYASEMRKLTERTIQQKHEKVKSPEAEALLKSNTPFEADGYAAGYRQQMRSLLWRGCLGALRDVHLTQIRVVTHFVVALLLGALYQGAGQDGGRTISNTGCLFFFLLFLYFSNAMPTIHTFPVEATVVIQEHLNKWYYLSTYCASKIIVDLPVQLLCASVFVFPAWYFTSQPMEMNRLALAWLICTLITILAQTFGLVVGAACDVKLGLFVVPAANIPMLMFSEFFIPYKEMPSYLQPFALISYFRYAFDAFLQTVYGFGREKLPCFKIICLFKDPKYYLEYLGLSGNYFNDTMALVIWILLLKISLICILRYKVHRACK
ncbi:ATP-binding cassette sub-family G member 4-like isoform X2 [Zerene cesonia]|uniref:ATP-binding cassette sub-family G member 4-like isoform X2 n=1 Tax=Zerene cesonia TaxID=33412 RepID=UPI0018E599D2|nr:ATP-binding cassette sub-family G member 4-like isoform X2 [Zerene cesonia]